MKSIIKISVTALLLLTIEIQLMALPQGIRPDLSQYQYKQTKNLVLFVEQAAKVFHEKGRKALPLFRRKGSRWFRKNHYLFIFDLHGNNLFNAADPTLEGKNIANFKGINGKPIIHFIIDIARNKQHPYGWVHYLWADSNQMFPEWKTSFVMRVTDPNGKPYMIGSGLYQMRMEKVFIKSIVDQAVQLLKQQGKAAFHEFANDGSRYSYDDTYIFVLNMKGVAIFDPSFPNSIPSIKKGLGRNLLHFKDAVGSHTVEEMITKMKTQKTAWIMYMWPKPHEAMPSRKLTYIRKVRIDNQMLIVGSDLFLESPIWMKH